MAGGQAGRRAESVQGSGEGTDGQDNQGVLNSSVNRVSWRRRVRQALCDSPNALRGGRALYKHTAFVIHHSVDPWPQRLSRINHHRRCGGVVNAV